MTWPTTLTTDADVLKYVWEQGIDRILESGNAYTNLHIGVATEIRLWLESKGGVNDADNILNTSDFEAAAAHLFFAKIIRDRDADLSELYIGKYLAILRSTRPELGTNNDPGSSGTVAKVVVIKQGNLNFTKSRSGLFKNYRVNRGS